MEKSVLGVFSGIPFLKETQENHFDMTSQTFFGLKRALFYISKLKYKSFEFHFKQRIIFPLALHNNVEVKKVVYIEIKLKRCCYFMNEGRKKYFLRNIDSSSCLFKIALLGLQKKIKIITLDFF